MVMAPCMLLDDGFVSTKNLVKKTMLKETRIDAGLGNPPSYFTTNSTESINAMLKNKVNYKKSELPEFLEKLRSVIDEQEKELERAIIDCGQYQLCNEYKKLEVKGGSLVYEDVAYPARGSLKMCFVPGWIESV